MQIVTQVTPRTVRIRDEANCLWKHIDDKAIIKFANVDFETGYWLTPQMNNKLLENGKVTFSIKLILFQISEL